MIHYVSYQLYFLFDKLRKTAMEQFESLGNSVCFEKTCLKNFTKQKVLKLHFFTRITTTMKMTRNIANK